MVKGRSMRKLGLGPGRGGQEEGCFFYIESGSTVGINQHSRGISDSESTATCK